MLWCFYSSWFRAYSLLLTFPKSHPVSLNPIVLSIPSCLILIGVELLAQLAGAAGGLAVGYGVAAQRGGVAAPCLP